MKVFGSIAVAVGVVAAFVVIMGRGAEMPADATPAAAPAQTTVQSVGAVAETECVDPVSCPPREGCLPKAEVKRCGTEAPVAKKSCGPEPVAKAKSDCADVVEDCEPSDCTPDDCTPEELEACKKPKTAVAADR